VADREKLPWMRPNRYEAAMQYREHHKRRQCCEPSAIDMFVAGTVWSSVRARSSEQEITGG